MKFLNDIFAYIWHSYFLFIIFLLTCDRSHHGHEATARNHGVQLSNLRGFWL